MIGLELNIILLILAFCLLWIGAWQDVKTREVADWIWLSMIGGGIIVHLLQLFLRLLADDSPIDYFTPWILNIAFSLSLALFLTLSGLSGEADRIAFIAIGIISPISPPFIAFQDPQYEMIISITPRILGTFFNAYLIVFPVPFLIFGYNIANQRIHPDFYDLTNESKLTRVLIRFIGYPRQTQNLDKELEEKPWHFDFLEEFKEEVGWRIMFRVRLDTPETDLARKQELVSQIQTKEKNSVWIQPSLPFILILMLGYLIDVLIGNLLLVFMIILI